MLKCFSSNLQSPTVVTNPYDPYDHLNTIGCDWCDVNVNSVQMHVLFQRVIVQSMFRQSKLQSK